MRWGTGLQTEARKHPNQIETFRPVGRDKHDFRRCGRLGYGRELVNESRRKSGKFRKPITLQVLSPCKVRFNDFLVCDGQSFLASTLGTAISCGIVPRL